MTDIENQALGKAPAASSRCPPTAPTSLGQIQLFWEPSSESTPLLGHQALSSSCSQQPRQKTRRNRLPALTCIALFATAILAVLVAAFALPVVVKAYAEQASVFHIQSLSYEPSVPEWARARIKGTFIMDADRVENAAVRRLGQLATWVAREIETRESGTLEIYQPLFGHVVTITASLPPIKLNVRDGHTNHLNFLSDIKHLAEDKSEDLFEGVAKRADSGILAKAQVHLRSGWIDLGSQEFYLTVQYKGKSYPTF
ncbi:uncharacterized protein BDW43DRAFT_228050 [Aspergillus alliaceus]|uniref:uncharacterized protein n=1 Tax=Petromyces alliaceus TaxID=209559 RepID=UPI0012A3C502|nr:uncharacterized protein BDW43DRAFT_228050 [Aspergillus alliaceus]KAB8236936.1 hypothetical protein BDW43DRAFT_228050 [Aspergillus alliaceus]